MSDDETVFFSDVVDDDGNVIASVTVHNATIRGKPVAAVKIPYDEMALDPERTIRVDLSSGESEERR